MNTFNVFATDRFNACCCMISVRIALLSAVAKHHHDFALVDDDAS